MCCIFVLPPPLASNNASQPTLQVNYLARTDHPEANKKVPLQGDTNIPGIALNNSGDLYLQICILTPFRSLCEDG